MAYVIGSQKGKDIAEMMAAGSSWTNPTDGSTWTKKSDGSVSVTQNGQTYNNAYTPTSKSTVGGGGSSGGGSKGGNSQYTNTNKIYNPNADYHAYINDAVAKGDYKSAAMYEQLRNQKILGEGLDYATTNLYGSYLDGYSGQKNQQDALDMFNQYMQEWEKNNTRPTEPERDPRIEEMLNQILSRDSFSYDVMNDPLYQQYAQMYQREGDRAMRETLAEAAASAGGMNSYAITAAQQANNYYNSQLNDKIPQLYQLAYDMYLKDKESQVQDLGLLQAMDDTQYNRYRNTMNDWYNDKSFAYGAYNDAVQQGNWQTNFDYGSTWDNINYNTDNYWKNKEWNANESDKELANSRYDQETAKAEVWKYIEMGVTPSADLISKAGMNETDVALAVQAVKAQQAKKGTSGGGSGSGSGGYTGEDKGEETPIESEGNYFETVSNACKELASKGDMFGAAAYAKEALDAGYINQQEYRVLLGSYNPLLTWMVK